MSRRGTLESVKEGGRKYILIPSDETTRTPNFSLIASELGCSAEDVERWYSQFKAKPETAKSRNVHVGNLVLPGQDKMVLVIADIHLPFGRVDYLEFCCRVRDEYKPDLVIHIGDVVDNYCISFHRGIPIWRIQQHKKLILHRRA